MKLRALSAMLAFALTLGVCWIGGLEFERGPNQALAICFALVIAAFAARPPMED